MLARLKYCAAIALAIGAYAAPTFAQTPQQQQQQSVTEQLLSTHANIEAALAKQLDAAHAQIQQLQTEVTQLSGELAKTKGEKSKSELKK